MVKFRNDVLVLTNIASFTFQYTHLFQLFRIPVKFIFPQTLEISPLERKTIKVPKRQKNS